uniref:SUEL-type lectin domain-containing protein n=1 Tax=Electrophorus electricus TaxID=8005 RepID=A0A4W4E1A1_ELEEL
RFVQHLSCDTGLINVMSAIYGRTDKRICTTGRPFSEIQNTACVLKIPIISARCNGLRQCEFKTDTLGSPDPCNGTDKYYNTTYNCIKGHVSVTCEDGYSTLDCGNDVIQIINANYGRTDSTTCSHGLPDTILADTNCYASGTLSIVATKCNGKSSCTVQASNTTFKDPCFGTSKYLTVSHHCLPHPTSVTCEGDNAVLTCGAGVLNIHNANYGRTDSTACSTGRPSSQTSKTDCYATNTLTEVTNRCEGKSSCVVPATNSVFSDPCYGTYKYLSIKYSCVVHSEFLFCHHPFILFTKCLKPHIHLFIYTNCNGPSAAGRGVARTDSLGSDRRLLTDTYHMGAHIQRKRSTQTRALTL